MQCNVVVQEQRFCSSNDPLGTGSLRPMLAGILIIANGLPCVYGQLCYIFLMLYYCYIKGVAYQRMTKVTLDSTPLLIHFCPSFQTSSSVI